jgi:uncharacterized protein YjdB
VTTADGGHIASCSVTVTPIKVTGISLSQNELTLILGNIQMLGATVSPGNATDKSYTWASDNSAVASVDSSGRVTANAIGTATISATTTDGNKIAACAVTVAPIRVTGVTLSERAASVLVGDTLFLRATVSPADATDASFAWKSSDTSIASIDTSGFVRTYKIGAATITATTSDGEKTAECVVTVGPVRVSRITISDSVISLKPTETKTLRATIAPENASDKRHTWSSSNNEIATVSQEGVVTAHRAGTATITVTAADGGLQSSCTVTVDAIRVSSVGVSETAVTLFVGESETLAVTISPANAGNKAVTWSSNTSAVATVDRAGQVTAQGIGTAILTLRASDGGVESYVTVRVLPRYVEAIVLRPDKLAMKIGETSRLSAEVSPFNATDSTYTWHSNNPSVATVDENGSVTGVSLGEATISAVANDGSGIKGECRVVVEAVGGFKADVKALRVSQAQSEAGDGDPTGMGPTNAVLTLVRVIAFPIVLFFVIFQLESTWEILDSTSIMLSKWDWVLPAVGSLFDWLGTDDNQLMKLVADIFGFDGSLLQGIFDGQERGQPETKVTGVKITPTNPAAIYVGGTVQLTAAVEPDNASNKAVTWESSNTNVATVSNFGLVTGTGQGTATITVTTADGGKTASCAVTVSNVPVIGVTGLVSTASVEVGKTTRLTASVTPSNASNTGITWTVQSGSDKVSVSSTGLVTGLKAGTGAKIRAAATGDTSKYQEHRF